MPEFAHLKPGLTAERIVTVDKSLVVTHTKTPVLSTPMMISLMEGVCKDLVEAWLPAGFITVGYEVNVKHKGAAPLDSKIKVWCKLLEVDGKKLLFEVRVTEGDRVIGEGYHRRTIILYSE